jgi:hypothetical protein
MDLIGFLHPYPDLSPSRGKEVQVGCNDYISIFMFCGDRKFMNHFVVHASSQETQKTKMQNTRSG